MRIISGKARGTKIATIDSNNTRPTLDRVKESLFNIIQGTIVDANVLDLFAGSGALGIETLSRGAKKVFFCDNNKKATEIIKQNLDKTKFLEKSEILNCDYKKALEKLTNEKFDIIFIDPPYKDDIAVKALEQIAKNNMISKNGIIIIETDEMDRDKQEINKIEKSSNIVIIDERKYGRANLIFAAKGKE